MPVIVPRTTVTAAASVPNVIPSFLFRKFAISSRLEISELSSKLDMKARS